MNPELQALRDAGKRLSERVTLHIIGAGQDAYGQWVAARLTDGGAADEVLYPTRRDAIRHNPDAHCYVLIPPGGMQIFEAMIYLQFNRALYENGMRMPDPEREYVIPQSVEDAMPGGFS